MESNQDPETNESKGIKALKELMKEQNDEYLHEHVITNLNIGEEFFYLDDGYITSNRITKVTYCEVHLENKYQDKDRIVSFDEGTHLFPIKTSTDIDEILVEQYNGNKSRFNVQIATAKFNIQQAEDALKRLDNDGNIEKVKEEKTYLFI